MSLLTSEAVVDSRECEILSAEEVEELKKVLATKLLPTHSDTRPFLGVPRSQDPADGVAEKA